MTRDAAPGTGRIVLAVAAACIAIALFAVGVSYAMGWQGDHPLRAVVSLITGAAAAVAAWFAVRYR